MVKHPKNKGNRFELIIYKDLVKYGECKRTIGSGSSTEPGDIMFLNQFAIECKHLKRLTWTHIDKFMDKLSKEVVDYYELDCSKVALAPVLIFRVNHYPVQVAEVWNKKIILMRYEDWKRGFK